MAIRLIIEGSDGEPVVLDAIIEHEDNYFWVHSQSCPAKGLIIEFPYGEKPKYNCQDTEVLLLSNPFQGE